jgi:NAD(P)-dependent dehydrogenase (short-subunit alcohol dehydrogenase family)
MRSRVRDEARREGSVPASDVLVVIGAGGMGRAIARRCGSGATLLLADVGEAALDSVAHALTDEGHRVQTQRTDVSDRASVRRLADAAASLGSVRAIAHTAGVSPVQAPADTVVAVDLLGVAYVLDELAAVVAPGGAAVVISSMAGHLAPALSAEDERALAQATLDELPALPCVQQAAKGHPGLAYAFAKRATAIRVRAASVRWGRRGARVCSISPGIIATPMGRAELAGPTGALMDQMTRSSACQRLGTPDDVAAAAEFLLSQRAAFITGIDLLVDGGVVAAIQSGQLGKGAAPA